MAVAPWIVSDELWGLFEPVLPRKERRFRYPSEAAGRGGIPEKSPGMLHEAMNCARIGAARRHRNAMSSPTP